MTGRRLVESDLAALRAAAVTRVIVAGITAAVGVAGARWWEGWIAVLFLAAGLVWLPWALYLLAGSAGPGRARPLRVAVYGGPVSDLVIVFAAQCLMPWAWGLLLLAEALVVSLAASLWRRRDALLLLGLCAALAVVAQAALGPDDRVGVGLLVVFGLALAGLVDVVGHISDDHRLASVNSHRFQKKAETILARVADGIVVTDGAGVVLETNPAGERLIGAEQGWPAIGMPCIRALGLHDGESPLDCRSGCPLLSGDADADLAGGREVWRLLPDGRRQPLLAAAFAVADEQGGVEVVHSLRDVTRLKEADEAKTLFLATASHELKTPVTVIAGFAETILRYPDMPPARRDEAVESIRRRALELSSIVDRLLLSSKIEGGRVSVDIHPVDVRALVVERGNAFQDASGRHVVVQVAHQALVAMGDPLALRTIVDHLLDNAVKYSDGGPVVLGSRREAGRIVVSVSDIGIGMDEDQARHCFDKFWQAESTDGRRFGGTGIGLYIVSSMVDAMRGTISVETAVGQGSTFTVSLPLVGEEIMVEEAEAHLDESGMTHLTSPIGVLSLGTA